jgi:CHAT domain-containing protein/Tfp pilus assembly protein PilF
MLLARVEGFHRARGEGHDAGLQTNNMGLAYFYEARYEEAKKLFQEARDSFLMLGERPRAAVALQNIALSEWGLGRLNVATASFKEALQALSLEKQSDLFLQASNNLALINYARGDFDTALRLYDRALADAKRTNWPYYQAWSYYGLGVTYYSMGDRALAAHYLRKALELATLESDGRTHVQSLRSLAIIAHQEGDHAAAVRYFNLALASGVAASARARIKVNLATTYAAMGKTAESRRELDLLIENPSVSRAVRADARLERARMNIRIGNGAEHSIADLERALSVFRQVNAINGQFEALLELARLRNRQGDRTAAELLLMEAIKIGEEIEGQSANPEYRASLTDSVRPARSLMLELMHSKYRKLLAAGELPHAERIAREALTISDAARARAFGQYLIREYQPRIHPNLLKALERRTELQESLADRRFYLSTQEDRDRPGETNLRRLRDEIMELRRELGLAENELGALATVDRRMADMARGRLTWDTAEIPREHIYVEYWIGDREAYAWVAGRGRLHWRLLAPPGEIKSAARELHRLMSDGRETAASRNAALEKMHALVMAPLTRDIGTSTRLVIVPDGPLHVVPFAALRGSGDVSSLIDRHVISFVPALRFTTARFRWRPKPRGNGRSLIVADPVYESTDRRLNPAVRGRNAADGREETDDPVGAQSEAWTRLTSSAREAQKIAARLASNVDLLQDQDATREGFLRRDLSNYRFIHVATHGEVDTEVPQLSALVLGAFGRRGPERLHKVRVGDLLTRDLSAELVVLSACRTSLGPEFASEGPISLRYAALARGAGAVISSLWQVADGITADLMTDMYGQIVDGGLRADEALAVATRRLLGKRPGLDPAQWAPFTAYVLGE